MVYADFIGNVINLIKFIIAMTILFVLVPKIILKKITFNSLIDVFLNYYIKMIFFYITIGYILVFTKLFELLSIITIIILFTIYNSFSLNGNKTFEIYKDKFMINLYKSIDDINQPIISIKAIIIKLKDSINKNLKPYFVINKIPFVFVFLFSAYLRFYDSIVNMAPALSDSYVTLEWMKNIDRRQIFKSGIYPQGLHIILATINKVSANDAVYMIKFMGPFNGLITTLGIYFFLSRTLKSKPPALLASFFYGCLNWLIIGNEWDRQAATNSQEFAFAFVFPTLYFIFEFIKSKEKKYLILFFCGTSIIGFVHTFAFLYLVIGVFSISIAFLIKNFKESKLPVFKGFISGVLSSILSLIPMGIAIIIGNELHSSSVNYLVAYSEFDFIKLNPVDYIALICILVIFIYTLVTFKYLSDNLIISIFILISSIITFVLYFAGGVITKSVVINARAVVLWGLNVSLIFGFMWNIITIKITDSNNKCSIKCFSTSLVILITIVIFKQIPNLSNELKPIIPYKMEWDSSISQYLKIKKKFPIKEWLYISNIEGYSIVLGSGFHMVGDIFLDNYSPESKYLYSLNTTDKIPNIFIYIEKKIFKVEKSNSIYPIMEKEYIKREKNYKKIEIWIEKYKKTHNNIKTYYEDENIKIYHIEQKKTKKDIQEDIWDNLQIKQKKESY
jgi:hypothetical protein